MHEMSRVLKYKYNYRGAGNTGARVEVGECAQCPEFKYKYRYKYKYRGAGNTGARVEVGECAQCPEFSLAAKENSAACPSLFCRNTNTSTNTNTRIKESKSKATIWQELPIEGHLMCTTLSKYTNKVLNHES